MKQWFLYQIWSWTFNKSWSLSGVQQTLFLDQDLIPLLSISYSGLKFECSAVLAPLKFFCPRLVASWWQVCDILSSKFIWQLKWVPYYELKYTLCWNQRNKSQQIWGSFIIQKFSPEWQVHWIQLYLAKTLKSEIRFRLHLFGTFYLLTWAWSHHEPLSKVVVLL